MDLRTMQAASDGSSREVNAERSVQKAEAHPGHGPYMCACQSKQLQNAC